MASLTEQKKALTAKFNAQAAAMKTFIEEKNPLGFGGVTPTSEIIEEFEKMHADQVKFRDELDKMEELEELTGEFKSGDLPADVDIDALVEKKLAALQAHQQMSSGTKSDSNKFVKQVPVGMGHSRSVLNTDVIAQMVGNYVKSRGLRTESFEKNGSTNHKFVFTWNDGQASFDKDPQRFAAGIIDRKALFTSTATVFPATGAAGELGFSCNLDIDPDVCIVDNPEFCITDCIPVRSTTGGRIWYTRQTVRDPQAAGVAETVACNTGTLKPESNYGFATIEIPVITIAHVLCISDEAMDDCETMTDLVRGMLREDLLRRERQYIITGTGAGGPNPQYRGILNTAGILSHTFRGAPRGLASDTIHDAIRRAKTDIMLAGKTPDCVLIHPHDAERADLSKSSCNVLLYPNPNCEQTSVWCLNICADADVPEGTVIVGGMQGTRLYRRQEVVIEIGYTGDQFRLDEATIRAKMRGTFAVKCPQGIVRINNVV